MCQLASFGLDTPTLCQMARPHVAHLDLLQRRPSACAARLLPAWMTHFGTFAYVRVRRALIFVLRASLNHGQQMRRGYGVSFHQQRT
jgi:hypothetical protein